MGAIATYCDSMCGTSNFFLRLESIMSSSPLVVVQTSAQEEWRLNRRKYAAKTTRTPRSNRGLTGGAKRKGGSQTLREMYHAVSNIAQVPITGKPPTLIRGQRPKSLLTCAMFGISSRGVVPFFPRIRIPLSALTG